MTILNATRVMNEVSKPWDDYLMQGFNGQLNLNPKSDGLTMMTGVLIFKERLKMLLVMLMAWRSSIAR